MSFDTCKDVWVFIESFQGQPKSVGLELLGQGRKLADGLKQKLAAYISGGIAAVLALVSMILVFTHFPDFASVLVGVLVFEFLKIVLQFLGVNPYYNYMVQGIVIVTAVALDIRKYIAKK